MNEYWTTPNPIFGTILVPTFFAEKYMFKNLHMQKRQDSPGEYTQKYEGELHTYIINESLEKESF